MQKRSKKSWAKLATRVTLGLLVAGGTLGWAQGVSAIVLENREAIDSYIGGEHIASNTITVNTQGVDVGVSGNRIELGAGHLIYGENVQKDVSSNTLTITNTLAKYGSWYGGYADCSGKTLGSLINLNNNRVYIGIDANDDTKINLGGKNGESGLVCGALGDGSAVKNVQNNEIVMYTGKAGSLVGGSQGELTKSNTVTMHNGEAGAVYGASSSTIITISQETWEVEDTSSSLGAMYNTVNIYNGTVRNSIIGGYANYKANSNNVNISGGNVGAHIDDNDGKTYYGKSKIVGGESHYFGEETQSDAKNNSVTINFSDNNHLVGTTYIIGGYGYGSGSVCNNVVNITNGTYYGGYDVNKHHVMVYVAGGATLKGNVENNQVTINSGLFSTDETEQYNGGYLYMSDSMIITGGLATSRATNADVINQQGTIKNNTVTINGGKFGRTTDNYATTGAELLINGSIVGGTVEAGYSKDIVDTLFKGNSNIIHNTVNITGGDIYANVLGGYTAYGDNKENIVNITGGNITGSVYGGGYSSKYGSYSSSDIIIKGKVITDNNVNIGNGSKLATIGGNVYGGYIKASSYNNNNTSSNGKTTITGADVQRNSVSVGSNVDLGGNVIAGGYMTQEWKGSASGIVNNNSVTIRRNSNDSAINATIYGGYNYYGDATNNKVTITGGTIGSYVYGAYSSKGEATGNTINISGNTDLSNANIYGGAGSTSSGNTLNLYTYDNDVKNQWTKNTVKSIQNVQRINLGTIDLTKGPAINAQSYLILPNVEIHLDGITGSGNIITSSSFFYLGEDPKVYINGVQQANVGGGNVTAYDNTGVVITKEAGIEIGQKYLSYVSAEGGTGKTIAGIYTSKDGKVYVHDNVTGDSTAETGSLTLATSPEEGAIVAGAYNEAIDTAKAKASGGTLTLGEGKYTGNFYAGYSKNGTVSDNKIVLQADANVSGAKLYGSNTEGGTNNVLDANALTTTTNINSINNFNIIKLGSGVLNLIGTDASNLAGTTIELKDKTTARTLLSGNITGVDSLTINGVNKNAGVNYAKKEATNSVTKVTSGGWDVTGSGNNVQVAIKAGSEGNEIAGLYIASDGKKYSYADNTSGNATSGTLKLGTVTVAEGKTYAGAYAEAGAATGGTVEISGAVNGAVYAGYAAGKGASVTGNNISVKEVANLAATDLKAANDSANNGSNTLDLSAWTAETKSIKSVNGFTAIQLGNVNNVNITSGSLDNSVITVANNAQAGILFRGTFSVTGATVTGFSTDGRTYAFDDTTNGVCTQGGLQASITEAQIALVAGAKGNNIAGIYYDSEGVGHNKDGANAASGTLNVSESNIVAGKTYAGSYAEGTQAATGGTVNVSGDVTGNIYAGYSESGAANNNTMNLEAGTDASEANLYGRNGEAGSGNVLNMKGGTIKVGVVEKFDTINIGADNSATTVNVVGTNNKLAATDVVTKGNVVVDGSVAATNVITNGAMTVNGLTATTVKATNNALTLKGDATVDNMTAGAISVENGGTVTVNKSIEATSVNAGTGAVNLGTSASTSTVKVDTVNAGTGTVNINASGNVDVKILVASGTSKININSGNLLMDSVNMNGVATGNVVVGEKASVTGIYASLFKDDGSGLSANAQKLALNNTSMVIDNSAADAKVMSINDVIDLDKKVQSATVKVSDESKLKRTVSIGNLEQAGDTYKELIEQSTVEAQKFVLVGIDADKAGASVDGNIDNTKADNVTNNLSVAKLVLNQEAAGDVNGIAIAGGKEVTLVGAVEGGNVIEVKDSSNNPVDKAVTVLVGSKEAGTGAGILNIGKTGSDKQFKLKANVQVEESGTLNINGKTDITGEVKVVAAGILYVNDDIKVTGNLKLAGDDSNAAEVKVADGKSTEITGNLNVIDKGSDISGRFKVNGSLVLEGKSTVLNVGNTGKAGKLTVDNIKLNGGTIFLDPAFVPGKSIEGASSLEVNTDSIDGKYIAGKNSVVAFGTMEGATEAFNKFAEVNSIEWAEDGVSAAMYIANNVTLAAGGALAVNGKLTTGDDLPTYNDRSAQFADNSLLMVNGSATQSTAAISGATSLNVAGSAKLYIACAEKENTYKIVEGAGIAGTTNNWAVDNVLTDSAKIKFINASTADLVAYNAYSVSIVDAYDGKVIIDNVLDAADDDPKVNAELKQFIDKATSNKTFDEAHQINAMDSLGAMNELGGVSHATQLAIEELADIVANSAPLGENVGGKGVSAKTEKSKNVWAKLVHKKDKVDSLNVGGMAAKYNVNLNGVVVGSDLYDDGTKSAGVALSYMDGKVTGYNMDVKTRNDAKYYGLAMYGRMQQGKARLLGDVTYLHGDNDLEQYNVVKASGKAKSDAISVGVRAEADMKLGAGKLTPYTGLRYTRVGIGKYHNSLGLQYDADVQNLVNIPLGLKYSADIKRGAWTIRPSVDVGYVWNLGDRNSTERVSYGDVTDTFGYSSVDKGRFVGGLNVAVETANISYSLGYDYNRSSNTKANRFNLGFQCKF